LFLLKEKVEANRKVLQQHTCALFDVAVTAEAASRGSEGGNILSQRAAEGQSRLMGSDLGRNGPGEREVVYSQEDNLAAETLVQFVKLPLVDRIPPYTTWIFLDKYSAVAHF
jgi:[histone H3]-lysine27 N-trimethyltransferase EZH2